MNRLQEPLIRLALCLLLLPACCYSSDAREFETSVTNKSLNSCRPPDLHQIEERSSENLGFRLDQLITAVKTANKPLQLQSMEITDHNFILRLSDIDIAGAHRKSTRNVIYASVSGAGIGFNSCMEKVIRLANIHNKVAGQLIVDQFTTKLAGQPYPDEYLERDGKRYRLQKIKGILTFHCTNARADNRAILRAQPQ